MFKFISTKENSPSFNPYVDFDHNVNFEKDPFAQTYVNLATTNDNKAVIYLNTFGFKYKYFKNIKINILEGNISEHRTSTNSECKSDYLFLASPKGKLSIGDGFSSMIIEWILSDEQVQIFTYEKNDTLKDSCIIHFQKGVIDPNIQRHIDRMLEIYETMPDMMKPHMWKTIAKLRDKFGLIVHQ